MTILLQVCSQCGARQYPPRDLCRKCLTDTLGFEADSGQGVLLAQSTVHRTLDKAMAPELPLRIGSVKLDAEVRVLTFLSPDVEAGERVELRAIEGTNEHQRFIAERISSHD